MIVTTEFLHEARVQRDALGMHDLTPVVIQHPLSTLTDAEIDQRVDQAVEQCIKLWLGRTHPAAANEPTECMSPTRTA